MKLHARKDVCNPFHLSWFWWQYQDFEGNGICLDLHLMLYKTFVRYYRSMHIPQHCQGIKTQFWNSKNSKRFELTSFIIFLLNEFLEFSRQSANFKVIVFRIHGEREDFKRDDFCTCKVARIFWVLYITLRAVSPILFKHKSV